MGRWFQHRHSWRATTNLNTIINPDTGRAQAALIIEECRCGGVRTIEFAPGTTPIVRYAETEPARKGDDDAGRLE